MGVEIEHFPDNRKDRRWCFVWTRAIDGKQIRFNCMETEDDCKVLLAQYQERARVADDNGWEAM